VRWSYSGIRPLLESENAGNPSAVTRDYLLEVDARPGEPPLLSLFGGKMTTFRKLAEEAVDKLGPALWINCPRVDFGSIAAGWRYRRCGFCRLIQRHQTAIRVAAR
jgi:glycerol-3-phosphate dehydrogenase